jgi:hypothetical protein
MTMPSSTDNPHHLSLERVGTLPARKMVSFVQKNCDVDASVTTITPDAHESAAVSEGSRAAARVSPRHVLRQPASCLRHPED